MAIAPIDLQTLFTQVDKVGKAQTAQKEGLALQQAIQGAQLQKKTDEQIQQVNETQDTGEGVDNINDKTHRQKNENKNRYKNQSSQDSEESGDENADDKSFYNFRDPSLGNKIDITY